MITNMEFSGRAAALWKWCASSLPAAALLPPQMSRSTSTDAELSMYTKWCTTPSLTCTNLHTPYS